MGEYYVRLWRAFWADFRKSTGEQVVGALLTFGILVFQIRYGVIRTGDAPANLWSIAWPYVILVGCFFVRHLIKAPYVLDQRHESGHKANSSKIAELEKKCLDEQPRFGIRIGVQAGDRWFEERDDNGIMVQFIAEYFGGRVPTDIRFDPVVSRNGTFWLTIRDIPFLSPNPPRYEHLAFCVWINGRRPEDDMYAFNKTKQASWLDNFVNDRPKAMDKCVYPLVVRYKDVNDERVKKFEIDYATKIRFFSVRQVD